MGKELLMGKIAETVKALMVEQDRYITKSCIMDLTGYSRSSVTNALVELRERYIVWEVSEKTEACKRPVIAYRLEVNDE